MSERLRAYLLHITLRFGMLAGACGAVAVLTTSTIVPGRIATSVAFGTGAGFAIALGVICAPMDYYRRARVAETYGTWSVNVKQERILPLEGRSVRSAVTSLSEIATRQKDFVVRKVDAEKGLLELQRRPTWQSLRDRITIHVVERDSGLEAIIVSRPGIGSMLVDYGQNLENVEILSTLLR